ncbi:MAG: magnesium transporter [Elusimicrobia bacterium]|nr:magnesium transporter [Elusimicrobiota bacterium]
MFINKLIEQDLKYYLAKRDQRELAIILNAMEVVDLAYSWESFSNEDRQYFFSLLTGPRRASLLGRLQEDFQDSITSELSSADLAKILNIMEPDERAGLLKRESSGRLKDIFTAMGPEAAKDAKKLLIHAPDTAGGIMTTEFTAVGGDLTAREALLNLQGRMKEGRYRNVHTVYVTDEERKVMGGISLMGLIGSEPGDLMKDIALPVDNTKILAGTDIEEVSALFAHYDLLSAAVVDPEDHMLGVITIDDIVDVIRYEAEEDIAIMAGVDSQDFHRKDLGATLKSRLPWLMLACLGGVAAGGIIEAYESALQQVALLVVFIPVIMDMGGNMGVQSSTVIVRGLSLRREIDKSRLFKVFTREFAIGIILSLIYALLLGFLSFARYGSMEGLSSLWLVTGLGIGSVMVFSAFAGILLPLGFRRVGVDPAVATGPILTTIIDVVGLVMYFLLATRFVL